jgi:ferric-dicitrate binding protein FerR (iron transport regulator)
MHRRPLGRSPFALTTAVLLAVNPAACNQVPAEQLGAQAGSASALVDAAAGPRAAEVTAVSGPGGLRSPGLAEGTFLGKAAKLEANQAIETPKGTLAELALEGGARLRLNEDTALVVPSPGGEVTVTRGEVVALVDARTSGGLALRAGDDTIRVEGGEVQLVHARTNRHVAVVHGRAIVESNGQRVELGAGERLTTPLASPERPSQPELSLQPLADTGWSRAFEQAALAVDAVPRGVGSLTARVPGSQNELGQKIRLTEQRVTVNISGRMAHTEIEQAFFNERPAVLEGIYRFPLPGDGSISGLQLLVGNRWMEGEIVEKQRARQIFQQIVDATVPRDPALLEWERGNVFKLRLFPIPGRGERRVKLSYTQVLPVVGDDVRYRFPLGGTGASGTTIDRFSFAVNVDKNALDTSKLDEIETPMLALARRDTGDVIQLSTEETNFQPTYDLGVDLPVAKSEQTVHSQTHLDRDGQAYFMLALQPELEFGKDERPIHFAFVVDRSHSTTPELWTVARGMVEAMTGGMESQDRFTVLACDTACDELPTGLQTPSAPAVEATRRFLEDQDLAGASDLGGMLAEAGDALARSGGADARKVIVYLGDGAPSSGELAPDKLATLVRESIPDVRVEALALGARADLVALNAVVEATGGDVVQVDARDNLAELVRELRLRAEVPLARNLRIETPDGLVDVRHNEVAGLRPGDELVVTGKLAHPVRGDVRLLADGPTGPIEAKFAVDLTASRTAAPEAFRHLPRTWATMEIAHLTKTKGFDAHDRIVALSKDYTVLSRFTALLVLENDAMFREFNVVRTVADTDRWKGQLDAPKTAEVAAGLAGKLDAPKSEDAASEAKPTEELDNTAARGATATKGVAPSAAPGGAPEFFDGPKDAPSVVTPTPRAPSPDPAPASGPTDPFAGEEVPRVKELPRDEVEKDLALGDDGESEAEGDADKGGGFAPPPPSAEPAKAKKEPMPATKPSGGSAWQGEDRKIDDFGGGGSWAGDPWGGRSSRRHWRPQPRLKVAAAAPPSGKNLSLIESLRRSVAADTTRRSSHGGLVRAAIRVGHADALAFARAWADADPDHAPALTSLADVLAGQGDPIAPRAYASALEITPFSSSTHDALARAFENKGDLRRSCSHRRAIVSIDPSDADHHARLAKCLHQAGRTPAARTVLADARGRATKHLSSLAATEAALSTSFAIPGAAKGQLRASLTWTGEDDLDIAIVDAGGHRLSASNPKGLTVRESAGFEEVALSRVKKSVFVEVTRNGASDGARLAPVRATLEVRTPSGTKTFPVVVDGGSVRLAKVFWTI